MAITLAMMAAATSCLAAAAEPVHLELNSLAPAQDRCRLSFVIENKDYAELRSLKLDLVLFGREGVIAHRLIAEMGPLRAVKTVVKTFEVAGACDALGAILVNDVTACAPGPASGCLDRIALSSRAPAVKLFK